MEQVIAFVTYANDIYEAIKNCEELVIPSFYEHGCYLPDSCTIIDTEGEKDYDGVISPISLETKEGQEYALRTLSYTRREWEESAKQLIEKAKLEDLDYLYGSHFFNVALHCSLDLNSDNYIFDNYGSPIKTKPELEKYFKYDESKRHPFLVSVLVSY